MAVAPRSWQVSPPRPQKPRPLAVVRPTVQPLPSPPDIDLIPLSIRMLRLSKQMTQWLAIASVTTAMGLYAGKAYNQKGWSESFQHLLQLQDREARLVVTSASLGEYFRQQAAQPSTELVDPTPAHNLYIPAPDQVSLPPVPTEATVSPREQSPIGY